MMRLFVVTAIFSFRALFHWLQPVPYVVHHLGFPLMQLSFFCLVGLYGSSRPLTFYLIGNAIAVSATTVFGVAQGVADERGQGTLSYLLGTPASRVPIFFGRAAVHVVDGLANVMVAGVIAVAVFGLRLEPLSLLGLAAAVIVAVWSVAGLGLLIGAISLVVLDATALANYVMFALLLVTGANVPLEELPVPLATAAQLIPLTHTIAAARIYAAGGDLSSAVGLLAFDGVLGAAYAAGGFALFRRLEAKARRDGSLEGF